MHSDSRAKNEKSEKTKKSFWVLSILCLLIFISMNTGCIDDNPVYVTITVYYEGGYSYEGTCWVGMKEHNAIPPLPATTEVYHEKHISSKTHSIELSEGGYSLHVDSTSNIGLFPDKNFSITDDTEQVTIKIYVSINGNPDDVDGGDIIIGGAYRTWW